MPGGRFEHLPGRDLPAVKSVLQMLQIVTGDFSTSHVEIAVRLALDPAFRSPELMIEALHFGMRLPAERFPTKLFQAIERRMLELGPMSFNLEHTSLQQVQFVTRTIEAVRKETGNARWRLVRFALSFVAR